MRTLTHYFKDPEIVIQTLISVHSICKRKALWKLLELRYEGPKRKGEVTAEQEEKVNKDLEEMQLNVWEVMRTWMELHHNDFEKSGTLFRFASEWFEKKKCPQSEELKELLSKISETKTSSDILFFSGEEGLNKEKGDTVSEIDPMTMAEQLSLMEATLMLRISVKEFVEKRWISHQKEAPNLTRIIDWCNKVAGWCQTVILREKKEEEHVERILMMIQLAKKAVSLGSFNVAFQVYMGLNASGIMRLEAWKVIEGDEKQSEDWKELKKLFATSNNWKVLRKAQEDAYEAGKGTIPCISMLLKDLFLVSETQIDRNKDGLINMSKVRMNGTFISKFVYFVSRGTSFLKKSIKKNPVYWNYIAKSEVWLQEHMDTISQIRQPKQLRISQNAEDEPVMRRTSVLGGRMGISETKSGILSARKNRTASVASETKEEGEKFGPLEATDWRLIFAGGKEISFKKGDILIGDNQKPRDVYLVVEGEVHIKAKTIEGPKMITKVKKNCYFAESSLIAIVPRFSRACICTSGMVFNNVSPFSNSKELTTWKELRSKVLI